MGYRLESRETRGAYSALIYKKGALVLRMMHFLFTDPATGDGRPFFDLMSDFVKRYKDGMASTEQFFAVANEHVKATPLAQRHGYTDLNWFYRQWVAQTYLPSYHPASLSLSRRQSIARYNRRSRRQDTGEARAAGTAGEGRT